MNWVYVMGYPLTEPYWIRIKAGGQERWVLMQAFQRRVLTYSPFNAEGWKVEMATWAARTTIGATLHRHPLPRPRPRR